MVLGLKPNFLDAFQSKKLLKKKESKHSRKKQIKRKRRKICCHEILGGWDKRNQIKKHRDKKD